MGLNHNIKVVLHQKTKNLSQNLNSYSTFRWVKTGGGKKHEKKGQFPYKFRLKTPHFEWLLDMGKLSPNSDFLGFSDGEYQNEL